MKNTERKSSVLKDRKFGYEAKAIFYPLTSGKDYATISPTKREISEVLLILCNNVSGGFKFCGTKTS